MFDIPDRITSEAQLDAFLTEPYPELVDVMRRIEGDILILGAGGKMGPSLAHLAVNACRQAGVKKRIIAVSRFSDRAQQKRLAGVGVDTVACDLLNVETIETLPQTENVIFMVGRKFGAAGSEWCTWMTNVVIPAYVARAYRDAKIVVFSTGCIYPFVPAPSGGSRETDPPAPVGEYCYSCLGRERVFQHYSNENDTRVLLMRLNYAVALRYGVLLDIAQDVKMGLPVDVAVPVLNCIWQGDANNRALLCLEHTRTPPAILNVTGPEILSVEEIARRFAEAFGCEARFTGTNSGRAYLSDPRKSMDLFGPPRVDADTMIEWVAEWVQQGGRTLDKPTLFHVTDGQFLKSGK
jgi:nucleoside-diphosphate-sugar epimerase